MKRSDLAILLSLAALWGASYLFMRLSAGDFGAIALAGVRAIGATLCLLPLLAARSGLAELRAHWKPIALVGITSSALPFALFAFAALSISAGLSSIFNAATPLFAAVIGWLWLRDRLTASRVVGLAVGFAGVLWLVWDKASFKPGATGWAVLACIAAAMLYGFSANFTKRHLGAVSPLTVAAGGQLASALLLVLPTALLWPANDPGTRAWSATIALAIGCTAVAYVLFFRLIANVGASRAVTVSFLIPGFAVAWGALFLGETFTVDMALGCAVILAGTGLTTGLIRLPVRRIPTSSMVSPRRV